MILRNLILENFGKFRNRTFEFRRGLNLVVGPNEAGKSTLAEAIPAILFGVKQPERFKPWGRGNAAAALVFEGAGRTIEIRRDLLTDEVSLTERDDLYHNRAVFEGRVPLRGRSAVSREYRAQLEALIGIVDDELFRATSFFSQRPREWSGESLAEKLRVLVGGAADVDYAGVLDSLLAEHFELTRENPWGRNKPGDREYERLCNALADVGSGADCAGDGPQAPGERPQDEESRARIAQLRRELDDDRAEYAKGVRYVERLRSRMQETTPEPEPPPGRDAPGGGDAGGRSLKSRLAAAGLPGHLPPQLPEVLAEAAEIRRELAKTHEPLTALARQEKRVARVPWLAISAGVLGVALMAAAAWWFGLWQHEAAGLSAFVAAILLGWGGWREWRRRGQLAEIDQQKSRLERQRAVVQSRQGELRDRCEALGLPTSPVDLVRLQKTYEQHRDLLHEAWGGERREPAASTDAHRSAEAAAEAGDPDRHDVPDLAEMEQRLEEFAADLQSREAELSRLIAAGSKEAATTVSGGDPAPDVRAKLERRALLEEKIAILRCEVDLLSRAVDVYGKNHLTELGEEAGRLLGRMTGGRYQQVRFDSEMQPEVKVDERRWVSAARFSRGTIDAIYLALRVALAKVRAVGPMLPLVLDDPFVHLDRQRMKKAIDLVDLVAAEGQVILLSHNEELGKRAARERWHVVPLDETVVEVDHREDEEHAGQLHLL